MTQDIVTKSTTKTKGREGDARLQGLAMALGVVVFVLLGVIAVLLQRPPAVIGSYEACKDAGGQLSGAASDNCLIGGVSFVKDIVELPTSAVNVNDYIGLPEKEALAKAVKANVPARIIQRDDQPLPMTMDFREGRLNMHVKDGNVTQIDVEGQE